MKLNSLLRTGTFMGIALLGFACSNASNSSEGKTVFRYNEPGGISSLDPAFCRNLENIWAVNMLYNGLVELDEKQQIKPALAKEWRLSDDGLSYFFDLRTDVYFHNDPVFKGKPRKFVASDVVYSFERILLPQTASPGAWVFNLLEKDTIHGTYGIRALNDSLVEIKLSKAFPAFLSLLSMQYCSIVPLEAVQAYGNDFSRHPVGTGPFTFFIWEDGQKLVLHKNASYFESDSSGQKLPYLDAVAISFLKDKNANFLQTIKGDFDFLSGLDASYKDELLAKDGQLNARFNPKFYLQKQAFLKTDYLGFNLDSASYTNKEHPILNRKFRLALNKAINRNELIAYLRNNVGESAAKGFVPSALFYGLNRDDYFAYNVNEAQDLLYAAGYANGVGVPKLKIATTSGGAEICEYIQKQWQRIGLQVDVEIYPEANHREAVANGAVQIFRKTWVADYPDAQNFLSVFDSKAKAPNGPNYTRYENAKFDKAYTQSLQINDPAERQQAYLQLDELISDDAPMVPLFYDEVVRLVSKRVSGLPSNSMNLLDLKRVKIKAN